MMLVPFAVFAQTTKAASQTYPGWNSDRTVYYLSENKPATGLFKAKMSDGVGALFYADKNGKVVKKTGPVTVSGSKTRYLRSKDSEGHWGFRKVSAEDTNAYTYFIGSNGEGAIVEESKFYKASKGRYFVRTNGTVKTDAGFVDYGGKRYYIKKGGVVRTKTGWIHFNGKKYRMSGGVVRTKQGTFKVGNFRYVVKSDTSICTKIGPVTVGGSTYYVRNKNGVLGKNKEYTHKGYKYHVNKKGEVQIGRHRWKDGKLYYSVKKGYLKNKKALVTQNGERFLVEKGGLVVVDQKFTFNNRQYIADKSGTIYTGLFKWGGKMYYASDLGVLKRQAGVVKVGNYSYFVKAGGEVAVYTKAWDGNDLYIADKDGHLQNDFFEFAGYNYYADDDFVVYRSKRFTVKKKTYFANSKGNIQTGVFYFEGTYYYADPEGVLDTDAKLILHKGKYYYNNAGGGLASKKWVYVKGKHYYAGEKAAFLKTFTYNGVKIHAADDYSVSDDDYYKAMHPDEEDGE